MNRIPLKEFCPQATFALVSFFAVVRGLLGRLLTSRGTILFPVLKSAGILGQLISKCSGAFSQINDTLFV